MVFQLSSSHNKIQKHAVSFSVVFWWNLLTIMFVIAGLVSIFYAFRERKNNVPSFVGRSVIAPKLSEPSQKIALEPWVPFEVYAPSFTARDIFKTDEEKVLEASQKAVMDTVASAGQWGEGYRLVGVIVDSDPCAIVQELNPPGVRTVKIGDKLGDATLVQVRDGLAVFERQDQRVELRFDEKDRK